MMDDVLYIILGPTKYFGLGPLKAAIRHWPYHLFA